MWRTQGDQDASVFVCLRSDDPAKLYSTSLPNQTTKWGSIQALATQAKLKLLAET